MSAKPETTFTKSVHDKLPLGRKDPYWMKNSNTYTSGIWDVWYSGTALDMWVEYKFIVVPKLGATIIKPELSALQEKWGRERMAEGRNMAVIVGCKDGGVIFENLEWESEITAAAFKVRIQSRAELARWIIDRVQKPSRPKRK